MDNTKLRQTLISLYDKHIRIRQTATELASLKDSFDTELRAVANDLPYEMKAVVEDDYGVTFIAKIDCESTDIVTFTPYVTRLTPDPSPPES